MSTPPPSISIKANLNTLKRRFSIPPTTTFSALQTQLSTLFSLPPPFILTYEDDEHDLVHISTDSELAEALRLAQQTNITPLRLHLYHNLHDVPDKPPSPTPAPPPQQPTQAAPPQQPRQPSVRPENPMDALGTFLETVINSLSAFPAPNPPVQTPFAAFRASQRRGRGGRGRRGAPRAYAHNVRGGRCHPMGRRGAADVLELLGGILGQGTAVLGRFEGLLRRLDGVSDDTVRAVEEVRSEMTGVDVADVATVGRSLWVQVGDVGRDIAGGRAGQEWVDHVVQRVNRSLEGVAEGVRRSVEGLVRVALADDVVRDVLREVGEMGDTVAGGDGGAERGTDGEGREEASDYQWQGEQWGDGNVPPPPISVGERGPRVEFLQKVLTDVGYMTPDMYRWGSGLYGPNTKAAVTRLQRENGLEGAVEEGVYDATTAASLASLLDAQARSTSASGEAGSSGVQRDGPQEAEAQS